MKHLLGIVTWWVWSQVVRFVTEVWTSLLAVAVIGTVGYILLEWKGVI